MSQMHQINGRQLTFIITGAQVGSAMLVLPVLLSQAAGQHAWMCVILGAVIPWLTILIIDKLGKRHSGLNIVQLLQALLGRVIGSILIIVFALYFIAFAALLINAFSQLIRVFMLPRTPLWVTILLANVCVVYACSKGGRVVGRINETLFFGLLLSLISIIVPTLYSADITNLLPLGELDAMELIQGAFYTLLTYAGAEVLLVFYSQVERPEEIKNSALRGLGLSVVSYLILTVCCLLVFGPERIAKYSWPGVTILKVAQIPVLERLEFYFLAIWIGIVLRRVINPSFAAGLSLAQLFKMEERMAPIALGVGIAVSGGSFLIPSNMVLNTLWLPFSLVSILIGVILPLILLIISFLRKGVVKSNASV